MDDIDPEQLVRSAYETCGMFGIGELAAPTSAMVLIWEDISKTDCACDACVRVREILAHLELM